MKVTLDGDGATLRLDFDSAEALREFTADWLTKEGCLVRLSEPLKLWTELTVELLEQGALRLVLEVRVMQVFASGSGDFATALQATDAGPLDAFAPGPATTPPASEAVGPYDEGHTEDEVQSPAEAAGGGEMLGSSPIFRIRQMNVSQKMRLASKATRGERQILLRDGSPQVLMGLLANPRIEDKEILVLAGSPSASGGVLQRIAKDRRWSVNYEIRVALVKNPQTPTPLAVQMLGSLNERDLRVMAKGSNVREAIRAAALRKIVKR